MISDNQVKMPYGQQPFKDKRHFIPSVTQISQYDEPVVIIIKIRSTETLLQGSVRPVDISHDKGSHKRIIT
jgi:hypothetical protein